MTGIAEVYLYLRKPRSKETRAWLSKLFFGRRHEKARFVVLSWKRTGSNLFCGVLYHHPEIVMHNELFNTIDIFTYFPEALSLGEDPNERWRVLSRDLYPEAFLDHVWTGKYADSSEIRKNGKAVGFKSFPEHWRDSGNEAIWQSSIMEDPQLKKIILHREDELRVFVSMMRAEISGCYMTHKYPKGLKVHVDPARFQTFVNNYRDTFQRKYKSCVSRSDTFRITYEQLTSNKFKKDILPLLWRFLGVDDSVLPKRLAGNVKQSPEDEVVSEVISNYAELEFCFRHTDVKLSSVPVVRTSSPSRMLNHDVRLPSSWSILLPICSRKSAGTVAEDTSSESAHNINRFAEIERSARYNAGNIEVPSICWARLEQFGESLRATTSMQQRESTECIVGIDFDDAVFRTSTSKDRIRQLIPVKVRFVVIKPIMYGKVCRIWNLLASFAQNDFILLLGDDVRLINENWQEAVFRKFLDTSSNTGLPFGAACIALNDLSFRGFPTFPVVHRWHMEKFGRLLPRQFVNQGADPFLFELYSRWNAAAFAMTARLENTIGGDFGARYMKHVINWPGQVLKTNLQALQQHLGGEEYPGICLDVVVPSYRTHNLQILQRIMSLRSSIPMNVRFWIVVDNPDPDHLLGVRQLARSVSEKGDGNYFVNVVSYGENRGASVARNTGYNYSTADWVLFLDDDVTPESELLDTYAGAIRRYPNAKVMVGLVELPDACNTWTSMVAASNVMFFYGVAKHRVHPPWGVTANLLVRGSRHNHTIQFKDEYPKSGGGEDIDFVFQMKQRYGANECVVSVPGARVKHPWWRDGRVCYGQIRGWAWGDSLCISKWPDKTFMVCPNWVEFLMLLVPTAVAFGAPLGQVAKVMMCVVLIDHLLKSAQFYQRKKGESLSWSVYIAVGAGTVISCQEISRVMALVRRRSLFSFCRRMDWFDGQARLHVLDHKLWSVVTLLVYMFVVWYFLVRA